MYKRQDFSSAGNYITIDVIAGFTETGWDYFKVYDGLAGTGNLVYSGDGDLTGVQAVSTTGDVSVFVDADGSVNCLANGFTPIEFTITCTAPPSCPDPSGFSSVASSGTSGTLSWTAGGTETAWNVEYGPAGYTQGSGTTVAVTTNPYTLTGLTGSTSYDVYVQADCGGGDVSAWVGPSSFTTPCAAATAPYTENFSSGSLPTCWYETQVTGSGWVFSGTPGYDASNNGRASGSYAWIDFSSTDVGAVLEAAPVDISGLPNPQLEFDFFTYGPQASTANILYVEYNDGTNLSLIHI